MNTSHSAHSCGSSGFFFLKAQPAKPAVDPSNESEDHDSRLELVASGGVGLPAGIASGWLAGLPAGQTRLTPVQSSAWRNQVASGGRLLHPVASAGGRLCLFRPAPGSGAPKGQGGRILV